MKIRYHLIPILLSCILVFPLLVCRADESGQQAQAGQNAPSVSQDTQSTEREPTVEAAPELSIPEKNYEFENVPAGQTVTHDFILHNRGTAPLHITRVKTG